MHGRGDCQAFQGHAVPTATLDVPRQDGLVADKVYFAIGETLAGIDVGAAGLNVLAPNLLAESQGRKSQKRYAKEFTKAMPHKSPHQGFIYCPPNGPVMESGVHDLQVLILQRSITGKRRLEKKLFFLNWNFSHFNFSESALWWRCSWRPPPM
jgi:hypothetical protein